MFRDRHPDDLFERFIVLMDAEKLKGQLVPSTEPPLYLPPPHRDAWSSKINEAADKFERNLLALGRDACAALAKRLGLDGDDEAESVQGWAADRMTLRQTETVDDLMRLVAGFLCTLEFLDLRGGAEHPSARWVGPTPWRDASRPALDPAAALAALTS